MAKVNEEVIIGREPSDAWNLVGDVANIHVWVPMIESSELHGDRRTVRLADGSQLEERITGRDDATRSYGYEILESPFGLTSLQGRTEVFPHDDGCRVVWSADVAPDELETQIRPMYASALQGLKEMLER